MLFAMVHIAGASRMCTLMLANMYWWNTIYPRAGMPLMALAAHLHATCLAPLHMLSGSDAIASLSMGLGPNRIQCRL